MSQSSQPTEWQIHAQSAINIERSCVITNLKYRILENVLGKWLWDTFGETAFYEADSESGAGYWKVTAPRKITETEQQELRRKPSKKRKTSSR